MSNTDGYGSSQKPVVLDPFQIIDEVGWGGRADVIAVQVVLDPADNPQRVHAAYCRVDATAAEHIGHTFNVHPEGSPPPDNRDDPDLVIDTELNVRLPTTVEWDALRGWYLGEPSSNPDNMKTYLYNAKRLREVYGMNDEATFTVTRELAVDFLGGRNRLRFRAWKGEGQFQLQGFEVDYVTTNQQKPVKLLLDRYSPLFPPVLIPMIAARYNMRKEVVFSNDP